MNNIYINIEAYAGSHIGNVCKELCELRRKLGLDVTVEFNEIILVAGEHETPEDLVARYFSANKARHDRGLDGLST